MPNIFMGFPYQPEQFMTWTGRLYSLPYLQYSSISAIFY